MGGNDRIMANTPNSSAMTELTADASHSDDGAGTSRAGGSGATEQFAVNEAARLRLFDRKGHDSASSSADALRYAEEKDLRHLPGNVAPRRI